MYEYDYEDDFLDTDSEDIAREVAERHAAEDRIEDELCAADPDYAAERQLREMGG